MFVFPSPGAHEKHVTHYVSHPTSSDFLDRGRNGQKRTMDRNPRPKDTPQSNEQGSTSSQAYEVGKEREIGKDHRPLSNV